MASNTNPDLAARLKTALILIVSFIALVIFAVYSEIGAKIFSGIVFLLVVLGAFEYAKHPSTQSQIEILERCGILIIPALLIYCLSFFYSLYSSPKLLFAAFIISVVFMQALILYAQAIRARDESKAEDLFSNFARDYIGFLLLGIGGAAAVALACLDPIMSVILVVIVSVADSASYFSGRAYGKSKIAPLVSPKKTVVGTLVGVFIGSLVGTALLLILRPSCFYFWPSALLASIAIVISSQSGDFVKSIAKRHFAVKDFGNLLPGHGGVLDRLDGIFGAAPLVFALLVLSCRP